MHRSRGVRGARSAEHTPDVEYSGIALERRERGGSGAGEGRERGGRGAGEGREKPCHHE